MASDLRACDATEKLLMSFDTMSYTTPSPVSSPRHRERNDVLGDDLDDEMEDDEDDEDDENEMDATSEAMMNTASSPVVSDLESHIHGLMLMPPVKSLSTTSPSKPSDKVIATSGTGVPQDSKFKKLFEPIVHQRTIGAYTPTARKLRLEKFHEKRKKRIWKKSIKYDCRKKLADDRPRIKGRFVRVLENLGLKSEDEAKMLLQLEEGEVDPQSVMGSASATVSSAAPLVSIPLATTMPGGGNVVPTAIVIGPSSSEVTPPQGNSPLAAAATSTLSPTVNHSIHFGSFGTFPSPVVMVKLEPSTATAFPLVGRAIMG
ncbi:hypothetical protein DYB32_004722 [Aphanomyces invadans]|nr:hypothetical protein DYB32_004722 [Aphanomyces invadans]